MSAKELIIDSGIYEGHLMAGETICRADPQLKSGTAPGSYAAGAQSQAHTRYLVPPHLSLEPLALALRQE